HLKDPHRMNFDEPNRITIVLYQPGVWVWVIPFSSGITSMGFVGSFEFFDKVEGDLTKQYETLIEEHPYLKARFGGVERIFEPRKLEAWSATTEKFYGKGYV